MQCLTGVPGKPQTIHLQGKDATKEPSFSKKIKIWHMGEAGVAVEKAHNLISVHGTLWNTFTPAR